MTSFAFILGVVPLVLATGAGAEMRTTLGIAVFSGMLGVTIFGVFFTPVFFYVIRWFGERRGKAPAAKASTEPGLPQPVEVTVGSDGNHDAAGVQKEHEKAHG
jgi:multidrug efflux pump